MLKLGELEPQQLRDRLQRGELLLDIHPFVTRIQSSQASLARDMALLYADFPVLQTDRFADFHVSIRRDRGLRRWYRPLIRFCFDDVPAFTPLQADHATASLEWGLNWCVSTHSHQYLVIHAAVIERHGVAVLLPAPPGSGKSTLCAALVQCDWRLLSDELALYDAATGRVFGMARPVNLKNASINVIRDFAPQAVMTAAVHNTTKGTVALLRPPAQSVRRARESATPACIVLPKYEAGAAARLSPHSRAETAMLVAQQSFNYDVLGQAGFEAVTQLLDACECHRFEYSDLAEAVQTFDALAARLKP